MLLEDDLDINSEFLVFIMNKLVTNILEANVAIAAPATPHPSKLPTPKIRNGSRRMLKTSPIEKM
ncbi:hypothetical protein D3C77_631740 [compost metagenome]